VIDSFPTGRERFGSQIPEEIFVVKLGYSSMNKVFNQGILFDIVSKAFLLSPGRNTQLLNELVLGS